MPVPGDTIAIKDALSGDLIFQSIAGTNKVVRLVTWVDGSASPIYTTHFADGGSITYDEATTGAATIFVYQGTIL